MDIKSVATLFSGEISDLQKRRQPVELAPAQSQIRQGAGQNLHGYLKADRTYKTSINFTENILHINETMF